VERLSAYFAVSCCTQIDLVTRSIGDMKLITRFASESGKIGYVLLWLLGIPLPVLLLIYLLRG
jgi:hypothetical protein